MDDMAFELARLGLRGQKRPMWVFNFDLPGGTDPKLGEYHVPRELTARYFPKPGGEPAVTVVYTTCDDGSVSCREVHVTAMEGGRGVRGVDLRLSLDDLAQQALDRSMVRVSPSDLGYDISIVADSELPRTHREARRAVRKGRHRVVTDDLLREVAEVYRAAISDGAKPTEAVQHHLGKSHRTASDYIRRARERGVLGPSLGPGRAGERTHER